MRLAFLGFVQHNMQSVILGAEIGSSVSLEEEEEDGLMCRRIDCLSVWFVFVEQFLFLIGKAWTWVVVGQATNLFSSNMNCSKELFV